MRHMWDSRHSALHTQQPVRHTGSAFQHISSVTNSSCCIFATLQEVNSITLSVVGAPRQARLALSTCPHVVKAVGCAEGSNVSPPQTILSEWMCAAEQHASNVISTLKCYRCWRSAEEPNTGSCKLRLRERIASRKIVRPRTFPFSEEYSCVLSFAYPLPVHAEKLAVSTYTTGCSPSVIMSLTQNEGT